MALYTKGGCYPQSIPEMIQLEDGNIRTGSTTYTLDEIASAGWTVAPDLIAYDGTTHNLNWNSETSSWYLTEVTAEDQAARIEAGWRGVRSERNSILAESDYMVIQAVEAGTTIASDWGTYRQALRDITNESDPFDVTWPTKPS